jgi:hypothetical protein
VCACVRVRVRVRACGGVWLGVCRWAAHTHGAMCHTLCFSAPRTRTTCRAGNPPRITARLRPAPTPPHPLPPAAQRPSFDTVNRLCGGRQRHPRLGAGRSTQPRDRVWRQVRRRCTQRPSSCACTCVCVCVFREQVSKAVRTAHTAAVDDALPRTLPRCRWRRRVCHQLWGHARHLDAAQGGAWTVLGRAQLLLAAVVRLCSPTTSLAGVQTVLVTLPPAFSVPARTVPAPAARRHRCVGARVELLRRGAAAAVWAARLPVCPQPRAACLPPSHPRTHARHTTPCAPRHAHRCLAAPGAAR